MAIPAATRLLLIVLILAAGVEFAARGPLRFLHNPTNWNDFSQNYVASKLWLAGESPSRPENFVRLWKRESGSRLELADIRTHLAPPLGTLVLLAPIAALPWPVAKIVWLALLLLAFALAVVSLAGTAQFRIDEPRTLAFVAASLALAPFHTGIAMGNVSVIAIAVCALAMWAAHHRHDASAGVLLAVSVSLKPQIGAFFVLYYLARRRWRIFLSAAALTAGLVLLAALYLQIHGVAWFQDYLANAKGFFTADRIDDFTAANPIRFTLINLQVAFGTLTPQASTANLLAFSISGILLAAWLFFVARRGTCESEILDLSAVSVLSLLPVYHRFYDAALLLVPLCWGLSQLRGKLKMIAALALLLMVPFLVPGTAFLEQLAARGKVRAFAVNSWWWNSLLMPHQTWLLLLLGLVLLYAVGLGSKQHRR